VNPSGPRLFSFCIEESVEHNSSSVTSSFNEWFISSENTDRKFSYYFQYFLNRTTYRVREEVFEVISPTSAFSLKELDNVPSSFFVHMVLWFLPKFA
jgi:hypothetical protein